MTDGQDDAGSLDGVVDSHRIGLGGRHRLLEQDEVALLGQVNGGFDVQLILRGNDRRISQPAHRGQVGPVDDAAQPCADDDQVDLAGLTPGRLR